MQYRNHQLWDKEKKNFTFLAFSCVHAPKQDNESVNWMLDQIRELKPDVIFNLGDFLEGNAASKFAKDDSDKYSIIKEFKTADEISKRIIEASPESRRIWIQGNHEANLLNPARMDKRFAEICDYTKSPYLTTFNEWLHPVEYQSDIKGTVRIGQIIAGHGVQTNVYSDNDQAMRFGTNNSLFISGHTHRPVPVTQARHNRIMLPYYYANAGTLGRLDRTYSSRVNTDSWGAAVIIGESTTGYSQRESKMWTAETKILKYKSDNIGLI